MRRHSIFCAAGFLRSRFIMWYDCAMKRKERARKMSIEEMTDMSHFLFAVSVLLTAAAVVLFFALDIVKCWRMVSGRHAGRKHPENMEMFAGDGGKTLPLNRRAETVTEGSGDTLALNRTGNEQTFMSGAGDPGLIRDIVYVQDRENQGNHS